MKLLIPISALLILILSCSTLPEMSEGSILNSSGRPDKIAVQQADLHLQPGSTEDQVRAYLGEPNIVIGQVWIYRFLFEDLYVTVTVEYSQDKKVVAVEVENSPLYWAPLISQHRHD